MGGDERSGGERSGGGEGKRERVCESGGMGRMFGNDPSPNLLMGRAHYFEKLGPLIEPNRESTLSSSVKDYVSSQVHPRSL